jgi:hypothetical protein
VRTPLLLCYSGCFTLSKQTAFNVSTSQKVEPHNSLRGRVNEIDDCRSGIGIGFRIQKAIFMVKAQLLDDQSHRLHPPSHHQELP